MNIGFDHCYQLNKQASTYFALESRGFALSEAMVEHPGSLQCRFIYFGARDSTFGREIQYLEFCHVTAPDELKKLYFESESLEIEDSRFYEPGFCMIAKGGLQAAYEALDPHFKPLAKLSHRNYEWKTDDVNRTPGWNFLGFSDPLVRGVYTWLIEYEFLKGRPQPIILPHPNTCQTIEGFVWDLPRSALSVMTTLIKADVTADSMKLADGSTVYLESLPGVGQGSASPFKAVVIGCENWETFIREAKPDRIFEWRGKPTAQVVIDDKGWDILVVAK